MKRYSNITSYTRNFSIYTTIGKGATKVAKAVSGEKAQRVTTAMGLATTAIGFGAAAKSLMGQKYSVVFKSELGPQHKTVTAGSPIAAVQKVSKSTKGTQYKAFRLPDQDDASQEYYQSLK